MLTLADSLRVEPFTLFRDVVYRDGQRSYTPRFYALPDAPRLARDERGGPAFDFLWYRAPPGGSAGAVAPPVSGGLVTLTVELAPSPEERATLAAAVVQALPALASPGPSPSTAVEILSMPFAAGTVALAFAGETAGGDIAGDFAARIAGSGPARFSGTERATFSVELTAEGAALLSQAIDAGQDLFHARYDLGFEIRLDDVELRIWCDARRSYDALAAGLAAGPLELPRLYPTLAVQHLAGVELTTPRPLAPEHEAALRKLGEDLLTAALGSAFFNAAGTGGTGAALGAGALRPFAPEIEATLNHTFSESFPAEQRAVLEGTIRLDKAELGDRLRRIDLDGGFFRILEVKIYCTVDFANDLIETVKARLDYDATGSSGRVQTSGEYLFREGSTVATFRTALAAPEERKVSCEVEIFYRAGAVNSAGNGAGNREPRRIAYPAVDGTAIVLDLDRLGVLTAAVALRDVPLARVRSAVVELEYPPDALSGRLILDGERAAGVWQAAVRDETAGPWRYRVSWLTADDRRVEEDWQTAPVSSQLGSGSVVPLDAPRELLATARVMVVAAGDFSDLAQVVVDLAAESGGQAYQTQMAFAQPGESRVWAPPVADRAAFRYRARRTLVYADGGVRALDWTDEDAPVLVVRDLLRVDVQVIARLLEIGNQTAYAFALLALEHGDAKATLVLRDPAAGARWSFRLAAPADPASYRWQLTLVPAQGPRVELPWQETDSAVLVLRPPSPPSPPPPPAA